MPLVVVRKQKANVRLYAHFSTGLNAALKNNHHPLPLAGDIFTTLSCGTCLAKLDLSEAYFQVKIEPESHEYLTINTHWGLHQFIRYQFGMKAVQHIMDNMISGLRGMAAYLDDIAVVGRTRRGLKGRIECLLEGITSYGFYLRLENGEFFSKSISILASFLTQKVAIELL